MQLVIGSTYESSRGFGRLLYLGETHDIDGYLPTFRTTKGDLKFYGYDQLPIALVEFAPPAVSRADELIACLEGEIAKRDARIVELEARIVWLECESQVSAAPVSEAKAEGVVMPERETELFNAAYGAAVESGWESVKCMARQIWDAARITAAPVQQAEYGDAYQGAREDLAIWKRRTLEAEEKVRQQEQIIDHLTSEAQGESRLGEPVVTPDAPCVPDGYVLADKKALGTVLQALVNAPHHIRELQVTRTPVELFSDNPINVLIENYEAQAAPAADAGLVEALSYQALFDAIAAATSVYANGAINISVQAFRAAIAAHRAQGVV